MGYERLVDQQKHSSAQRRILIRSRRMNSSHKLLAKPATRVPGGCVRGRCHTSYSAYLLIGILSEPYHNSDDSNWRF